MSIRIITDSLGDLPSGVAQELGITVIPVNLILDNEVYRDGIDMTTEQFYERLATTKFTFTTAVPPLNTFSNVYDELAQKADELLVITVGSKFSGTHEAAVQAVKQMKQKRRVEVIDSSGGCMQEGLLVIAAAKAVQAGATLDEVIALTRRNMSRVEIRFAFDTLEYLKRGGRIGKVQAFLGSMLKIYPISTIKDGEAFPVARERSRARVIEHLSQFALGYSHIDEVGVEDATTPGEAEILMERISSRFPRERIYHSKVSPVIGAHVGPHVLAVTVMGDK